MTDKNSSKPARGCKKRGSDRVTGAVTFAIFIVFISLWMYYRLG